MSAFLISYDLRKPGRNYARLYELLQGTWKAQRVAESLWLANLVGPAQTVRDFIRNVLDMNDRVVVIEVPHGADWATWKAIPGGVAMLSTYVTPQANAA